MVVVQVVAVQAPLRPLRRVGVTIRYDSCSLAPVDLHNTLRPELTQLYTLARLLPLKDLP